MKNIYLAVLALPDEVCLATAALLLVHFLGWDQSSRTAQSNWYQSYMSVDCDPVWVDFTTRSALHFECVVERLVLGVLGLEVGDTAQDQVQLCVQLLGHLLTLRVQL